MFFLFALSTSLTNIVITYYKRNFNMCQTSLQLHCILIFNGKKDGKICGSRESLYYIIKPYSDNSTKHVRINTVFYNNIRFNIQL